MIRSTRLLSWPEPRLFSPLLPHLRLPSAGRFVPTCNPTNPRNPSLHHRFVASLAPSRRREPQIPPATEPAPSFVSDALAVEEYVHVSRHPVTVAEEEVTNPNPDPEPLSRLTDDPARSFSKDEDYAPVASDEVSGRSNGLEASVEERSCGSKRALPEELAKSMVHLECDSWAEGGTCNVYLVGTCHVSQESCRVVGEVIRCLKPQVVFLELCSGRAAVLTSQNLEVPTASEIIDMWRKKKMNIFGILYSWFLVKVADKLEALPGSEFRVAFKEAMNCGAKVILGDRPIHITLRRTWGKMSLWQRARFIYNILVHGIFLPSTEDLNKMLKEMDEIDWLTPAIQEKSMEFPTLMETLLVERDLYMSCTLLKAASEHSSVVAVVGKAHLSGIKKHWKQPIEVERLLEIPSRSRGISWMKVLASVGVAATAVAMASGHGLIGKG